MVRSGFRLCQELFRTIPCHYRRVKRVPGGKVPVFQQNVPGPKNVRGFHGKYFVDDAEQHVQGGSDRVRSADGLVTVKNFLQNLGIGNQPAFLPDKPVEYRECSFLVRMGGTDDVFMSQ